jgi:putative GTP pyrophosphokinase
MKDSKINSDILSHYRQNYNLYSEFTEKIDDLIKNILKEKNFKVLSVTSRTKSIDSLKKKLDGEDKHYKKLEEITDLSGIRIICFFSNDVDIISKMIDEDFVKLDKYSIDKRKELDPDRFGYLSLHSVVQLSPNRAKLTEYNRFKRLKCELQIRSILQHAWAEIEHDLGYKSKLSIPREITRRFSRQAGLLELADEEFETIRKELEQYTKTIEEKMQSSDINILIDKITLSNYIKTSNLVKSIDTKISIIRQDKLDEIFDDTDINRYLTICSILGYNTISDLNSSIEQNQEYIIDFTWYWTKNTYPTKLDKKQLSEIAQEHKFPENVGNVSSTPMGNSIWMMGYIVAAQRGFIFTKNYVNKFNLEMFSDDDQINKRIIDVYKNISKQTKK